MGSFVYDSASFDLISCIISSGKGKVACELVSPYNLASTATIVAGFNLVESITNVEVGLPPVTATGVVDTSHEKVIASGLSLIDVYPFSDGAALHPYNKCNL